MLPLCSKDIRAETTIETPSYEDKLIEYDTWCVWHIQAPEGQLVNLKFDSFNLEKSGRYCEDAFLEIRQKNEFFGNVYCGEDLKKEEEITSNGNELNLYLDVRNNVSKGFRAEVHFLSSPEASDPVVVPSLASRLHLCSTFFILMGINLGLLYLM
ncbi:procollagen C-endopeptidase enhancer 2-like [Macrobrachium rosenbergii]|uniref:procollagen C-endopeptidase enhancer 2-like n=1 Tax=Macrobrachium rosenbergii TaxID=79674 RepID=UPI0034D5DA44